MKRRFCIVCDCEVQRNNDVGILEYWLTGSLTAPRHLKPISEEDVDICSGTPQVLQYLPGMPRAGHYVYDPSSEQKMRDAYKKLIDPTLREMRQVEKLL